MTETTKIPDLHLFGSSKKRRSSTKDFIEFQGYKAERGGYDFFKCMPSLCPPRSPLSSDRPYCEEAILYPTGFHQQIRAPSTYLDYAEGYLMGQPLPFRPPPTTGRFPQPLVPEFLPTAHNHNKYNSLSSTRRVCECQDQYRNYTQGNFKGGNKSPSRNVYLNATTDQSYSNKNGGKKQTNNSNTNNNKMPNKSPNKQPYLNINTNRSDERHQNNNNSISSPHSNSNKGINVLANILGGQQVTENESIIQQSHIDKRHQLSNEDTVNVEIHGGRKKHQLSNQDTVHIEVPGKVPKKMVSEEVQTVQNNRSQVNRSSVLIEKLMKNIPSMLDQQSFKKIIKQQMQRFNSIKIQFDDDIPIIDFEDLIETKEQYFQFSKELQARLNRLIGDKNEYKPKDRKNMVWPDL